MARKIAVVDSETDPFKYGRVPAPFIWGYYNGDEYHYFNTTYELVEFLKPRNEIIYAHNGGKFDWHFVLPYLEDGQEITIINGRLSKFKLGEAECRDSINILPVALSEYQKDDFDYKILERELRNIPENRLKIQAYLKSDCINLYDMVSKFIAEYGINLTLAGTSIKQWKKISKLDVPSSTEYYYDYFKPYYYGGRVQCFKKGLIHENFNVVDINSAYPRAMLDNHAYSLAYNYIKKLPPIESEKFVYGFYTITALSKGGLPFRDEKENKLYFPMDNEVREYSVTGWELKAAIETNTISDIKFVRGFMHTHFENFKTYIEHFYTMRKQAKKDKDKAKDLFAKLLMNSLYGKFATNPKAYKKYFITDDEKVKNAAIILKDNDLNFAGYLGDWFVLESPIPPSEMKFYNIATAASITGYVRAFLWRSICQVGIDNVLYCDTDSLATTNIEGLDLGVELGQWKDEGEFIYAAIAGRKLYAFKDMNGDYKIASKGARLTADEITEIAAGGSAYYRFDAPSFSYNKSPSFIDRNITST